MSQTSLTTVKPKVDQLIKSLLENDPASYRVARKPLTKVRTLTCCCCGTSTKGRQWWNRDDGYGVCVSCGESTISKEGKAAAKSYYGERGVHWDVDYKPASEASR